MPLQSRGRRESVAADSLPDFFGYEQGSIAAREGGTELVLDSLLTVYSHSAVLLWVSCISFILRANWCSEWCLFVSDATSIARRYGAVRCSKFRNYLIELARNHLALLPGGGPFRRAFMRLPQQRHHRPRKSPRSLRAHGAAHARRKLGVFAFGSALLKLARLCSAAADAA